MKPFILFLLLIPAFFTASANDVYYTSGNQLIPIFETDISVRKEILSLRMINNQYIEVTVYYEFFNPKDAKTIVVGFEAFSPEGDADNSPRNGQHPYIDKFTVSLNNTVLDYEVAYVKDSLYARNGIVNSLTASEISDEENWFYYVYHFKAKFKKGLNIIKHTYTYSLSGSVEMDYDFEYILTAAKRWANRQIDDFTLIIDPGEFQSFFAECSFFNDQNDWTIEGVGNKRFINSENTLYANSDAVKFNIRKGKVVFHRLNFKPAGELFVYALNVFYMSDTYDYRSDALPFSLYQQDRIREPLDEMSKKILRNLPFARRGYIFTTPEIQHYYETMVDWYIPDKSYKADVNLITEKERELVLRYRD